MSMSNHSQTEQQGPQTKTAPISPAKPEKMQAEQLSPQSGNNANDQTNDELRTIRCLLDHVSLLRDENAAAMLRACIQEVWSSPDLSNLVFNTHGKDMDELVTDNELISLLLIPPLRDIRLPHMASHAWCDDTHNLRWKCGLIGRGDVAFDAALDVLRQAARAAYPFATRNPDEWAFQMEARLSDVQKRHWLVRRYLSAIARSAQRPRLRPVVPCFSPSFGKAAESARVPTPVAGMAVVEAGGVAGVVAAAGGLHLIRADGVGAAFSAVPCRVACLTASADGQLLAAALEGGLVVVWDAAAGRVLATLSTAAVTSSKEGTTGRAVAALLSNDGARVIVAHAGGDVQTWGLPSGKRESRVAVGSDGTRLSTAAGMVLLDDGRHVATCDALGVIGLADTASGDYQSSLFPLGFAPCTAAGAAAGRRVAWGGRTGELVVMELRADGAARTRLLGHSGGVTALALSRDGRTAATGAADGNIRVWDVGAGGAPRAMLNGHRAAVCNVALRAGGRVVSAAADGEVRVWGARVRDAAAAPRRGRHGDAVLCVAVTADGARIVSAGSDGSVLVWDAADAAAHPAAARAHTGAVAHVETWGFDMFSTFAKCGGGATWVIRPDGLHKVQENHPITGGDGGPGRNSLRKDSDAPRSASSSHTGTRMTCSEAGCTAIGCTSATSTTEDTILTGAASDGTGESIRRSAEMKNATRSKVAFGSNGDKGSLNGSNGSSCCGGIVGNGGGPFEVAHAQRRKQGQVAACVRCDGQHVVHKTSGRVLATLPCCIKTSCAWCVSDDGSLLVVGLANGDVVWFEIEK